MPIRIEAEATCNECRAKARCTLDVDALISPSMGSPGMAMRGLPGWYYKDGTGNLAGSDNLACSEKCMAVLAKDTTYRGEWKPCRS
jgi:hypothetical protein